MTVVTAWPRMLSLSLAKAYVGGRGLFEAMKKQGYIKPKTKNPPTYDRLELDHACSSLPRGFSASSRHTPDQEDD